MSGDKPHVWILLDQTLGNINLFKRIAETRGWIQFYQRNNGQTYRTLHVAVKKSFPSVELSAQDTYTDLDPIRVNPDTKDSRKSIPKKSAYFSFTKTGNIDVHRYSNIQWDVRDVVPPNHPGIIR